MRRRLCEPCLSTLLLFCMATWARVAVVASSSLALECGWEDVACTGSLGDDIEYGEDVRRAQGRGLEYVTGACVSEGLSRGL